MSSDSSGFLDVVGDADARIVAAGVRPVSVKAAGALEQAERLERVERKSGRSPYVDLLPALMNLSCGFQSIAVPASTSFGTGVSAAYPLLNMRVPQDINQEFGLLAADVECIPTDSNAQGTGFGAALAWGTQRGDGAAIVIGKDLPLGTGWGPFPLNIPGVEATAAGQLVTNQNDPWIKFFHFPGGTYNDTYIERRARRTIWAPGMYRFPSGSRICVALVVRSTQIAASAGTIYGSASVNLDCIRTENRANWGI